MTKVPLALAMAYPGFGGRSRTTDTTSDELPTAAERVRFLDGYLELESAVVDAKYRVRFRDNGMMSAPSDWCITAALRVDPAVVEKWTEGLVPASDEEVDLAWWDELGLARDPAWRPNGAPRRFRREGRFSYVVVFDDGLIYKHVSTRGPESARDWR